MKKIILIPLISLLAVTLSYAGDCIMVKELKVKFINGSTKFVNQSEEDRKIKNFKDFINQTDLYVLIEGHTNKLSNAKYNYDLSKRRAVTVMNELVASGMKKSHVRAMGFGESTPLYSNNTQDGLQKNRRVIAEVFNSAEELDSYIKESKARIKNIKFKEQ